MYVSIFKQCLFVPFGMLNQNPKIPRFFGHQLLRYKKDMRTCIRICIVYIYIIICIIIIQFFHTHTITSIIMYKDMLYLQVKIMLSQPFECLVSHALHFYGSWCLECPTEFSHGNDSMDWLKRKTTRGNHAFYH